ncbi:MAG: lytic transglycosylase domain-containing protein, partial [Pseudomonadota bacterium]|nr:lytic transglycosylase domain-containing protein [Pseudomonadota bacterium]
MQPGQRAGAAFWAARTFKEERREANSQAWLRRAGESGRTFYGLLARRSLGVSLRPEPSIDSLTLGEADVEAVDATEAGHRAFALLQVGQDARAAAQLQLLWSQTRDKEGFSRSIMLVARQAGLTRLAGQFARLFEPAPVRLPDRRLRPKGGFQTDPALIYALARLESNFDPQAVSRAGARGLMQLMPSTADFITGTSFPHKLHDPSVSLDLGQRYLTMLAQYDLIGGDLIRLLASYNSGPGSLGKWIGGIRHNGDPLLFIESVPNDETRGYIPRALAYTWLYAAELRLPSPSLDELAAGSWPRFLREGSGSVIARLQ